LAYSKLNLESAHISGADTLDSKLYAAILEDAGDELFDENLLVVMGILLMKGSNAEKATLLFREWDIDISGNIKDEEVVDLISKMLKIATDILPIAVEHSGQLLGPNMAPTDMIRAYRTKMIAD
jgi:Ca2+-binding EF-hand superfamily protein